MLTKKKSSTEKPYLNRVQIREKKILKTKWSKNIGKEIGKCHITNRVSKEKLVIRK